MNSSPSSDPAFPLPAKVLDWRGRFVFTQRRLALLSAVAVFATAGATAWWWHATTRPAYLLQRGREAFGAGDAEDVWPWIDALALRGHEDEAALLQGELQFRSRQFNKALETLQRIGGNGDLHFQAAFLSGRCLLELGASVEAERVFSYLHSLRPNDVPTHQGLAAAYYDLGALPQAAAACETWARLAPHAGAPHRFRGIILKDMTQFTDAADAFRAALERELTAEQRQNAVQELASCLVKLNKSADGLAALAPLLQSPDVSDLALQLQAECLRGLGRTADAVAVIDRLLRQAPTNPQALRLRALCHFEQAEFAQAVALLEKGVRLAPRDRELRVHLSQAYANVGNSEAARLQRHSADEIEKTVKALTELTQLLPRDYHNPALHLEMATLYDQLDMAKLAEKCRNVAGMLQKPAMR